MQNPEQGQIWSRSKIQSKIGAKAGAPFEKEMGPDKDQKICWPDQQIMFTVQSWGTGGIVSGGS